MKYEVNADVYEGPLPPTEAGDPPEAGGRRECRRPQGDGASPQRLSMGVHGDGV